MNIENLTYEGKVELARISSDSEVLEKLSEDIDDRVRYRVARNPNTPIEALIKLSEDSHWGIRWRVAQNPNTPAKVLKILIKDEDEYVGKAVLENKNCPEIMKLIYK